MTSTYAWHSLPAHLYFVQLLVDRLQCSAHGGRGTRCLTKSHLSCMERQVPFPPRMRLRFLCLLTLPAVLGRGMWALLLHTTPTATLPAKNNSLMQAYTGVQVDEAKAIREKSHLFLFKSSVQVRWAAEWGMPAQLGLRASTGWLIWHAASMQFHLMHPYPCRRRTWASCSSTSPTSGERVGFVAHSAPAYLLVVTMRGAAARVMGVNWAPAPHARFL